MNSGKKIWSKAAPRATRRNPAAQPVVNSLPVRGYKNFIRENIREKFSLNEILDHLNPEYVGWKDDYISMLDVIRNADFEFKSLEGPDGYTAYKKYAYLRFDIHVHDIYTAFEIAEINVREKVPSTFYITWDFSADEKEHHEQFLCLKKFDPTYVHFGFHSAPATTWLYEDMFNGDKNAANDFLKSCQFEKFIQDLINDLSANGKEGEKVKQISASALKHLDKTAKSFRKHFPHSRTVTGHGNPITSRVFNILGDDETLDPIREAFHPVWLLEKHANDFGFAFEATLRKHRTSWGELTTIYDGAEQEIIQGMIEDRLASNESMLLLFHPLRWYRGSFKGLFDKGPF